MKTKTTKMKMLKHTLFASIVLLAFNACNKEELDGPQIRENPQATEINAFIKNLNYNANELLKVEDTGGQPSLKTELNRSENTSYGAGINTTCVETKYNLKSNFEDVAILKPNNGIIWPGALVIADESMRRGLPVPLTLNRAPMILRLDLPGIGEMGNIQVDNPVNSNVEAKIDESLEWWNENAYTAGYVNEASSSSVATTSYSSKQMSMEVGLNVEWASTDVASQFNYSSSSEERVAMMVYKQVFYTVSMDPPENPTDVFAADVPLSDIENAFNPATPPAYVHSVNYGRIIMFRMETTAEATDAELTASLNYAAGKNKASGDLEVKVKEILEKSSITTIVIGGNAEVAAEIVSARDFGDLEPIIKGENAVYSRSNPGSPISYTIRFLKDNSLAKMGYSTEYTAMNCTRAGRVHNEIRFINYVIDNFRVGIEYKTQMKGQTNVTYNDIAWQENKTDGQTTSITPPDGAYQIFLHVERAKIGPGYESKLRHNMHDYVNDNEDCWESYRTFYGAVEVRGCN